jgi:hypothetical protein
VTRLRCRAGVSEVQGQECSRHTETACPLWPLWRLGRRRSGTVGAARTVGFGLVWPGELIPGRGVMPVAK